MAHPPPSQRALFICDVQLGIIDIAFDGDENASAAYIERLNGAICHARSKGDKVIFIRIGYTPTFAEVGPNNRVLSYMEPMKSMILHTRKTELLSSLNVHEDDHVLTKTGFGFFATTNVRDLLKLHNIDTIFLAGISTSGVILNTVCEAVDLDYHLFVLSDGCYDPQPEVHDLLIKDVIPRRADILSIEEYKQIPL